MPLTGQVSHSFGILTLERIAVDYGIELLLLSQHGTLRARFESAVLSGYKLHYRSYESLSLLQSHLHSNCQVNFDACGTLTIEFADTSTIKIQADLKYEAWELVASNGDRWVCTPGGEIVVWTGAVLSRQLDQICNAQRLNGFILTGFILGQRDCELIQGKLTPDDPPVGAIGRYNSVPMYMQELKSVGSIHYSFEKCPVLD